MATNDKTPGGGDHAGAENIGKRALILHGNGSEAQRSRVIRRLRRGPATTIDLRREEDVMMPAARIHELRHKFGLSIDLVWVDACTDAGRRHRVGLYVLRPGSADNESLKVAA